MSPSILLFIGWEGGKLFELYVNSVAVTRKSMAANFAGNFFVDFYTKCRKHPYQYKDDIYVKYSLY